MKLIQHYITKFAFITAASALAFALWMPSTTRAAEPMKGGQHLLHLSALKTVGEVEALKTDDTVAMACGKCKTIMIAKVVGTAKGAEILAANGKPTQLIGTHACTGCGSTITVVGHGKAKTDVLKHTCKACGDDSAFCCAGKPGTSATTGMEKK